jgi:hypothetical protein
MRTHAAVLLVAACGSSGGALPKGPVALDIRVDGTQTYQGTTVDIALSLVGTLTFGETEADGWLAIDGLRRASDAPAAYPTTHSTAVSGSYKGNKLVLAPFTIYFPGIEGSADFTTFSLEPDGRTLVGDLVSTVHSRDQNDIEDVAMAGRISAVPDQTAPQLVALASSVAPVALDAIELDFSEPVDAGSASLSASSMALSFVPVIDSVNGLATGAQVVPVGYWPADATLTATFEGLVDQAGNAGGGMVTLMTPPRPDPSTNLGFELGMSGWLLRGDEAASAKQSAMVYSPDGQAQSVGAPVGAALGEIPVDSEITGFLVPPDGATTLSLELALIDDDSPVKRAQQMHRGVLIEITTPAGTTTVADGSTLSLPADPNAYWTGFQSVTVPLPTGVSAGLWLTIRTTDQESPVTSPRVLVDDVHF